MATGPKGLTENVNCQRYWVPAPMWKKAKQPISRSTPWPFVQRACWWGFSVTRNGSQMLRNDFKHDPHTHSNKTVVKVLAFSLNGIKSKSLKKKRGLFQLLYYSTRTTKSKNYYQSHFDCFLFTGGIRSEQYPPSNYSTYCQEHSFGFSRHCLVLRTVSPFRLLSMVWTPWEQERRTIRLCASAPVLQLC